jgi:hypothetical protein
MRCSTIRSRSPGARSVNHGETAGADFADTVEALAAPNGAA